MSATCNSCGKPIFWAVSINGSRMPLDAEPSKDGNVLVSYRPHSPEDKRAIVLSRDTPKPTDRNLYTSHFATCPDAAYHRRKARG